MISRRKFFASSALAAGGSVSFPYLGKSAEALIARPGQAPARIVHMVADGMSLGTLTCADYLSQHLRQRGLTWTAMMTQPHARRGLMNMRSINSMVTDSSAASSSWGSGSRVQNGVVNQLPSGANLTTLYEVFAQKGWKRGLVTTTEITHATPAGFAACVDNRDTGMMIAAQYLDRSVDVLLGGGYKFFDPKRRKDNRDLDAEFSAAGYEVMHSADQLRGASVEKRWLGTFAESHLPFTLDRIQDKQMQAVVPTLAEMTRRGLDWLQRHEHFILQVEGGRVDHGAHNCDAAAALREMIAFDEAVDVVLDFQRRFPDTLVVITTDHGNGNMGVNGSGKGYGQSSQLFKNVGGVKASFGEILRQLRNRPRETALVAANGSAAAASAQPVAGSETNVTTKAAAQPRSTIPTIQDIQSVLEATTGYKPSDRRAAWFQAFLEKKGTCVYELMNSDVIQLGQLLANHIAIGWTGSAHTSDYVELTAVGPGSERFQGFIQNVDVFRHYTRLAGIDFKNREEPLIADAGPEAGEVENLVEYAFA